MILIWFIILLFMAKLFYDTLTYSKQQQYKSISNVLMGLIVNVMFWLICEMGTQLFLNDQTIIFFHELKFVAILSIPGLLFTFAYELNYRKAVTISHQVRNIVIPIIFMALIATNSKHYLFRSSIYVEYGDLNIVHVENEMIYYIAILFIYMSLLSSLVLFLKYYMEQPKIYRRQIGWILLGISMGLIVNIVFQSLQIVIKWQFDFTPLSFAAIVWVFYGIFYEYNNKFIEYIVDASIKKEDYLAVAFISRDFGFFYACPNMIDILNVKEDKLLKLTIDGMNPKFKKAIRDSIEENEMKTVLCTQHNKLNYYEIETKVIEDHKKRLMGYILMVKDRTLSYQEMIQQRFIKEYNLFK